VRSVPRRRRRRACRRPPDTYCPCPRQPPSQQVGCTYRTGEAPQFDVGDVTAFRVSAAGATGGGHTAALAAQHHHCQAQPPTPSVAASDACMMCGCLPLCVALPACLSDCLQVDLGTGEGLAQCLDALGPLAA
jgi:hypothetical protein